jgi:hypothetical protein
MDRVHHKDGILAAVHEIQNGLRRVAATLEMINAEFYNGEMKLCMIV